MNDLSTLRLRGVKIVAIISAASAVIALIASMYVGDTSFGIIGLALAVAPITFALQGKADRLARTTIGLTLPVFAALFLALARGSGWIIDMHMTFFAFLAVLAALADWRPVVAATAVTAIHHIALNFVAPLYVFPDGPDFERVLFHALVVLVEAGILIMLAIQLENLVVGLAKERNDRVEQERAAASQRERIAKEQKKVIEQLGDRLRQLASGTLSTRIESVFPAEYEEARSTLNQACEELEALVSTVAGAAKQVAEGSSELRAASDDLAIRTERQAAVVSDVNRTTNSLRDDLREGARMCEETRDATQRAKRNADKGLSTIDGAAQAMNRIKASSAKIEEIVTIIDAIAFQTNLLALNAGVEAARAGDAGRGFSVVAHEVRQLAQRSAESASSIKELISQSTAEVADGATRVNDMNEMLASLVKNFTDITGQIDGIAQQSERMLGGIVEISKAMSGLDGTMQQNAAMVEESNAASQELSARAGELAEIVSRFDFRDDGMPGYRAAA